MSFEKILQEAPSRGLSEPFPEGLGTHPAAPSMPSPPRAPPHPHALQEAAQDSLCMPAHGHTSLSTYPDYLLSICTLPRFRSPPIPARLSAREGDSCLWHHSASLRRAQPAGGISRKSTGRRRVVERLLPLCSFRATSLAVAVSFCDDRSLQAASLPRLRLLPTLVTLFLPLFPQP